MPSTQCKQLAASDPFGLLRKPEECLSGVEVPATIDPEPLLDAVNCSIAGRYTLVERIGEGGMGSVWRAKQNEPVKRNVAVKLIKAGMDSRQVLARFDAERRALALMDHPNIAKVFDGQLLEPSPIPNAVLAAPPCRSQWQVGKSFRPLPFFQ